MSGREFQVLGQAGPPSRRATIRALAVVLDRLPYSEAVEVARMLVDPDLSLSRPGESRR